MEKKLSELFLESQTHVQAPGNTVMHVDLVEVYGKIKDLEARLEASHLMPEKFEKLVRLQLKGIANDYKIKGYKL